MENINGKAVIHMREIERTSGIIVMELLYDPPTPTRAKEFVERQICDLISSLIPVIFLNEEHTSVLPEERHHSSN